MISTGITGLSMAPAAPQVLAVAGADQNQSGLGLVTLDGSASSGNLTLAWTLTKLNNSGSSDATGLLSSTTAESPTFTPAANGDVYVASLTAANGARTDTDVTTVRIHCV